MLDPNFSALLANVDALTAKQVALAAEAAQERAVDRIPVAEAVELRLVVDNPVLAVEVANVISRDADLVEVDARPLCQVTVASRQEADASTALLKLRSRTLVDIDVEAKFAEEQGRRQPTERAPYDGDADGADHGLPNIEPALPSALWLLALRRCVRARMRLWHSAA